MHGAARDPRGGSLQAPPAHAAAAGLRAAAGGRSRLSLRIVVGEGRALITPRSQQHAQPGQDEHRAAKGGPVLDRRVARQGKRVARAAEQAHAHQQQAAHLRGGGSVTGTPRGTSCSHVPLGRAIHEG